jgi:hypothetical protein
MPMICGLRNCKNSQKNRKIPLKKEIPRIIIILIYVAVFFCYLRRTLELRKDIFSTEVLYK